MDIMVNKIDSLGQSKLSSTRNLTDIHPSEKENSIHIKLTKENIDNLVDTLNSAAKSVNRRISFVFNEKVNRVIMKVEDTNTNEVIREIPPKEMVRLLERFHELIGMFVDESR